MSLILDTAVRTSLVVVTALAVTLLLTRSSAALRHWVLTIALACAGATPLLQLGLPSWRIGPAFPSMTRAEQARTGVRATFAAPPAAIPEAQILEPPRSTAAPAAGSRRPSALAWIWLAGALLGLAKLSVGVSRLARVAASARVLTTGRLAAIATDVRSAIGLRRPVRLLQSDDPTLLVTWGTMRAAVLLPADAAAWPDDRARVVLQHEFAHVARGDWAAQMLAEVVRTVYWFNPLVWLASRRLRHEGERACDDAVLNAGVEPAEYASHLLELARAAARRRTGAALAMARPSSLEGRIGAMLNANTNRRPLRAVTRIATVIGFTAIAVPIAVAQGRLWTFTGTVVDQTSRLVPDAILVLTNEADRSNYEVRSDDMGRFEFVGLPSGDYKLAVQHVGFKTFTDNIGLRGDLTRTIGLPIATVEESIRVVAEREAAPRDAGRQAKQQRARRRAEDTRRRVAEQCDGGTPGNVGGQILPPLKLTDVRPVYPEDLKAAGISGEVTLDAVIGRDGNVRDVTAVSSPNPRLEGAAIDAVRGWKFSPTYLNCTPVEVPMRVTVTFVAP